MLDTIKTEFIRFVQWLAIIFEPYTVYPNTQIDMVGVTYKLGLFDNLIVSKNGFDVYCFSDHYLVSYPDNLETGKFYHKHGATLNNILTAIA